MTPRRRASLRRRQNRPWLLVDNDADRRRLLLAADAAELTSKRQVRAGGPDGSQLGFARWYTCFCACFRSAGCGKGERDFPPSPPPPAPPPPSQLLPGPSSQHSAGRKRKRAGSHDGVPSLDQEREGILLDDEAGAPEGQGHQQGHIAVSSSPHNPTSRRESSRGAFSAVLLLTLSTRTMTKSAVLLLKMMMMMMETKVCFALDTRERNHK